MAQERLLTRQRVKCGCLLPGLRDSVISLLFHSHTKCFDRGVGDCVHPPDFSKRIEKCAIVNNMLACHTFELGGDDPFHREELVQLNTTSSYPVDRNFFYCTLMLFCLAKGCLAVLAMR
eukprot:674380-Pelagomonas_calceolata.AAC.4